METPVFDNYWKAKDLNGYMAALWNAANDGDRDSLLALLYFSAMTRSDCSLDLMDRLLELDEDYITTLGLRYKQEWDKLSDKDRKNDILIAAIILAVYKTVEQDYHTAHPEHPYFIEYYGDADLKLRRAFINRVGRQTFVTPDIEEYRKRDDILGYMRALQKGVEEGDRESMMLLLYLSAQTSETLDALDIVIKMKEVDPEYATLFITDFEAQFDKMSEEDRNDHWKLGAMTKSVHAMVDYAYNQRHPEHLSPFKYYKPDMDIILRRAYCDGVGRQPVPEEITADVPLQDLVPQERKDYWRSLYSRSDCSSNQESIYNEALPYAEQGDPYAMFIVGYLLHHGIRTKYSNPNVTILEPDHELALTYLKRATEAGNDKAYWEVACLVPEAEELPWLEKGAELGNVNCLERLYRLAVKDGDDRKAFGYLVPLSDAWGSHKYTLELAHWYEQGRGCEKDEKKAYELAEYVYKHSSASPYDSSYEDSVNLLCRYLREGIGCKPDYARAGDIRREYERDEDELYELLCK